MPSRRKKVYIYHIPNDASAPVAVPLAQQLSQQDCIPVFGDFVLCKRRQQQQPPVYF